MRAPNRELFMCQIHEEETLVYAIDCLSYTTHFALPCLGQPVASHTFTKKPSSISAVPLA
jgi:hypothetical protein